MFDIYRKTTNQPLFYAALGCAVFSFFATFFFLVYFKIEQIPFVAVFGVPFFVYHAVMESDYRTRRKNADE